MYYVLLGLNIKVRGIARGEFIVFVIFIDLISIAMSIL